MASVKLPSSQPLALTKNSLLQKFLEVQKCHMELDHRIERRNINKVTEQCVTTAYHLLLEAEEIEKEKHKSRGQRRGSLRPTSMEKSSLRKKGNGAIKIRPMTAGVQITVQASESHGNADRRPSSALPVLEKCVSILEPSEVDIKEDEVDGGLTHVLPRMESPETKEESKSISNTLDNVATCINSGPPKLLVPQLPHSRSTSVIIEDRNTIIAKLKQRSNDKDSIVKKSNERKQSTMEATQQKPARKHSVEIEFNDVIFESQKKKNKDVSKRPKTANDFRKKCTFDENADYWNRRVQNLLHKWDIMDKPQKYPDNENPTNILILLPPEPPQKNLPKHLQKPKSQAEVNTRTFIQTYGSQYGSLIRPSSAPSISSSTKKRSAKITRQELTSIKADFSRQRKQTTALIKKSKKLINQIQGLVDASNNLEL